MPVQESIVAVEKQILHISVCVRARVVEGMRLSACVRVWVSVNERGRALAGVRLRACRFT